MIGKICPLLCISKLCVSCPTLSPASRERRIYFNTSPHALIRSRAWGGPSETYNCYFRFQHLVFRAEFSCFWCERAWFWHWSWCDKHSPARWAKDTALMLVCNQVLVMWQVLNLAGMTLWWWRQSTSSMMRMMNCQRLWLKKILYCSTELMPLEMRMPMKMRKHLQKQMVFQEM